MFKELYELALRKRADKDADVDDLVIKILKQQYSDGIPPEALKMLPESIRQKLEAEE